MSLFTITVPASTCVVRYHQGALVGVLPAGRHRRRWGASDVPVDLRRSWIRVAPQEIPSSDGIHVKVSAAVLHSVGDPVAYLELTDDPRATVYLAAQVALREALAGLTADELVQRQSVLPVRAMVEAVRSVAATVGVEVHEIVVKDVVLPPEIRSAALDLATAQKRAQVQLEAARAETAALRAQANAAKLLDDHPALAQLRLIQSAPCGTKLVIQVGDTASLTEAASTD
ncbi:slipin family protein [Arsenicicoccus piscis]|uniref:slipin family protein n=1 Tax=Arsenicicoccus piscis TaxID=673954 RepID=UPI001F4C710B|nr:slipin family protein [Arsenicicoccus piscis]MCH8626943.1 slipin family protein [Arsenicicoccus piscis]